MPEPSSTRATRIVAIVDDDEAIRAALARLIKTLDYPSRTFASAEDFLLEFDSLDVAAVLTDIQMPRMNGYALVAELHRRARDLPIILMTAYPSLARPAPHSNALTVEYMTKPLDDGRLSAWLARVADEPPQEEGGPHRQ